MTFQVGRYYRHTTGEEVSIVGQVKTDMYGVCLIAESNQNHNLLPFADDEIATKNWTEITREEWVKNFS